MNGMDGGSLDRDGAGDRLDAQAMSPMADGAPSDASSEPSNLDASPADADTAPVDAAADPSVDAALDGSNDSGLDEPLPDASVPATGNYVYFESDADDAIGRGMTRTYTQANAVIGVLAWDGNLQFSVNGDEQWRIAFSGASMTDPLVPGLYADAKRHPFYYPGLAWTGEGNACNTLTGWFAVDHILYDGDSLAELDVRFEQHCGGSVPGLRGEIHWRPDDPTVPPGPVEPPPDDLWRAPAGMTPATGNYVFVQRASTTSTYAEPAHTIFLARYEGDGAAHIVVSVDEPIVGTVSGEFVAMIGYEHLEPGYYGGLQRYPFHNPARGGLDWRNCNELTGWFVVDHVAYEGDTIRELDLRFEERCESASNAMHGQIHYVAP